MLVWLGSARQARSAVPRALRVHSRHVGAHRAQTRPPRAPSRTERTPLPPSDFLCTVSSIDSLCPNLTLKYYCLFWYIVLEHTYEYFYLRVHTINMLYPYSFVESFHVFSKLIHSGTSILQSSSSSCILLSNSFIYC